MVYSAAAYSTTLVIRERVRLSLKVALIEATKNWETLTGGDAPCPVTFDAEDIREAMKLDAVQREADESLEACRNMIGFSPEGWVPAEHYVWADAESLIL